MVLRQNERKLINIEGNKCKCPKLYKAYFPSGEISIPSQIPALFWYKVLFFFFQNETSVYFERVVGNVLPLSKAPSLFCKDSNLWMYKFSE